MHTPETCATLGCTGGEWHSVTTDTTCRKCGRPQDPWPLRRADLCSPPDWAVCIRPLDDTNTNRTKG